MAEVIEQKKTNCTFCGKEIEWDYEIMGCPECDGTGNDPYCGGVCPYCGGDGFVDAGEYLACCEICFDQEYVENDKDEQQQSESD